MKLSWKIYPGSDTSAMRCCPGCVMEELHTRFPRVGERVHRELRGANFSWLTVSFNRIVENDAVRPSVEGELQ